MNNTFSNLNSGLGAGSIQDLYLGSSPFYSYVVYPNAADSTSVNNGAGIGGIVPVQRTNQPTWVVDDGALIGWKLTNMTQWAILFDGDNGGPASNYYYQGVPVIVFDCPRTVQLTFSTEGDINLDNGIFITINGWDDQFRETVETARMFDNLGTVQIFSKSFKMIRSIYFSSDPYSTAGVHSITVTGSNIFGMPYLFNNLNSVATINWDGSNYPIDTTVTQDSVTYNTVIPGNIWRSNGIVYDTAAIPPTTSDTILGPATAESRGTINLASNSQLPDGSTQLLVDYYVYGNDIKLNKQLETYVNYQNSQLVNANRVYTVSRNSNFGSCAEIVQVVNNTTGIATLPQLVSQDIYGAQFPADLDFITAYNVLKTL